MSVDLADFQAIHTEPGDRGDYDVTDHIRCRRCGLFLQALTSDTLAGLIEQALTHDCLTERSAP